MMRNRIQFKCPSSAKWINKLWYNPTIEYHWAMKINEPLAMCNSMVESQMREDLLKKFHST